MTDFIAGFVVCALLVAAFACWFLRNTYRKAYPSLSPGTPIYFYYPGGRTPREVMVLTEFSKNERGRTATLVGAEEFLEDRKIPRGRMEL